MSNGITKEELDSALNKAINFAPRQTKIDEETHELHHKFVGLQIEKAERTAKRIEKFQQSIIGTAAALFVAGLAWLGKVLIEGLRHMGVIS